MENQEESRSKISEVGDKKGITGTKQERETVRENREEREHATVNIIQKTKRITRKKL